MPNTLTSIFVSSPATEPVEAPHPNTGVYVTGTQATAGGPWTVTHTLVTKTTTPLTMVGRLKNYPTVTVSVVASGGPNAGNIFNNVPLAPTGTSALGNATGINVTASTSPNGLANRILSSGASTGPFGIIYQGTTSSYQHAVAAGVTQYYQYQYVGAGYYDDSPVSAFSGTASAAAAGLVLSPTTAQFTQNSLDEDATTYRRRSPFATLKISTNATTLNLSLVATMPSQFSAGGLGVGVYDGPTYVGLYGAYSTSEQTITVPLPGTGTRTLTFIEGAQQRVDDAGLRLGSFITRATFPANTTAVITTAPKTATGLYVVGDSISNGYVATVNLRDGWLPLLRTQLGYDITLDGWGYRSWFKSLGATADQDALVARIMAEQAGRSLRQVLFALSTNDAYLAYANPTQVAAIVTSTLNKLKAADPNIVIYVLTPFLITANETTANTLGFTAPQYRTAIANAVTAAGGATNYDGLPAVAAGQFTDVHPTTAGHANAETYLYGLLQTPFPLGQNYLKLSGSQTFSFSSFSAAIKFTKTAQTGVSGQICCLATLPTGPLNPTGTGSVFGIFLNTAGQIAADIYTSTGTRLAGLVATVPATGDVVVQFKAGPAGMELRVNSAIVIGAGVTLQPAGVPLTIGACRTGTGDAANAQALNSTVTNFSFFSRILTSAESDALYAAGGQVTDSMASATDCLSYSRLVKQSVASTSLLDFKTGTNSILILTPTGAAGTADPSAVQTVVYDTATAWSYATGWTDSRAGGGVSNDPNYPGGGQHYCTTDGALATYAGGFTGTKLDYETAVSTVYAFQTRLVINGVNYDVPAGKTTLTGLPAGTKTLTVQRVTGSGQLASVCKFTFYLNS